VDDDDDDTVVVVGAAAIVRIASRKVRKKCGTGKM
jgi:hypothetical protein